MTDGDTTGQSVRDLLVDQTAWLVISLTLTAAILKWLGRVFWCQCGSWSPWAWDIWSSHNSQHLIDPYFFSHVLHGLIFYAVLSFVWKASAVAERFRVAILMEAAWEVLENSPIIIDRYRAVTISLDYYGDSIANSMFDILACAAGFLIAATLKPVHSLAVFAVTELLMIAAIRDSLILNVVMLAWPLDIIRQWQMAT